MSRTPGAKNKNASGPTAMRILKALARGQMHKQMLCDELGVTYLQINPTMTMLTKQGKVITLGLAGDAGYTDAWSRAPVYGLPGMTLENVSKAKDKSRGNGSGVIAGKITVGGGSRWGSQSGPWDWR